MYLIVGITSRNHHYVPKFLLKPWLVEEPPGQKNLLGYWWDGRQSKLNCKRLGLDSFCFQLDLLALNKHSQGPDAIERVIFGGVDTKGAIARDIILEHGPGKLTEEQRCDFARLLMSLEARRPKMVQKLRDSKIELAEDLNTDPELLAAMKVHGIEGFPSLYIENKLGVKIADLALAGIQRFVDNPTVGKWLVNIHWGIKKLGVDDGTFILSDLPLIRLNGFQDPAATWVLPLTPKAAFFAVNHTANLERFCKIPAQRFAKETNKSSAAQAERFVFSIEAGHKKWLNKYLSKAGQ